MAPRIPEYPSQDPMADDDLFVTHNQASGATRSVSRDAALRSLPADSVDTDAIEDGAITPDKMSFGAQGAAEGAGGTTTSNSYTATLSGSPGTNPAVTFTVPVSGQVLIHIAANLAINSNAATVRMSFALTGGNTLAADNERAIRNTPLVSGGTSGFGRSFFLTGLTPGSTTATLQYAVTGATGTYSSRSIIAIPIG